ncbi:UbiA family prenyltransferase [Microbacterium hatanonis]|uniref:1,4-dihydroxy-2-naphthoate prenyltransferase n=1 Tax=Microbacterium hatanonis TaxID=404366 RepID=A0A5C8HXT7_9MICO|nr:UbiA family prenyltransferase [Microbacterium hatanonis]TXK09776.1 1,4-dihydroxy-2-naphthoate prenyltransferase [Microbacterium hatanonis]
MKTVRALWGSTHPGPALVVTALSLALGIATGLDAARIALLVASVLCNQISVGLSNDAIDASRDRAVGRTDKPIAAGVVSVQLALGVAVGAVVASLALSAVLGFGMLAGQALMIAGAWAYNAGLKSSVFSLAPFLVSFGVFPSLATLSAPAPTLAPFWAAIAGAALGAAVHLTNVLPDLDDDRATGVRGFPHRIGPRASALLAVGGLFLGAAAVLLGPVDGDLGRIAWPGWLFAAAVVVVAVATGVRALVRPPDRTVFRLVMLAALLLAAQLVATGSALSG